MKGKKMNGHYEIAAAPISELKKKGCCIEDCASVVKLTISVHHISNVEIKDNSLLFRCTNYAVVPAKSHADWHHCFDCYLKDEQATIIVADGFVIGSPIPV